MTVVHCWVMRKLALLLVAALFAVACVSKDSEKLGDTRPSGPGQNTMAKSQSVALASDMTATQGPSKTTAVTKSDSTDTSAYCQNGIYVGVQDGGVSNNVAVSGVGDTTPTLTDAGALADANMSRILIGVAGNTFIPGSFQRIFSTGTTATNIVCFGH